MVKDTSNTETNTKTSTRDMKIMSRYVGRGTLRRQWVMKMIGTVDSDKLFGVSLIVTIYFISHIQCPLCGVKELKLLCCERMSKKNPKDSKEGTFHLISPEMDPKIRICT